MASEKYLIQRIDGRELKEGDFETLTKMGFVTLEGEVVAVKEKIPRYSVHYIEEFGTIVKTVENRKSKHPIMTMEIFGERRKRKETRDLLGLKLKLELETYRK